MQGLGKVKLLKKDQRTDLSKAHYFTGKGFESLVFGETKTSARVGEFGPEVGFAKEMTEGGKEIYIIKFYASGMPLHSGWNGNQWVGLPVGKNRTNFYPGLNAKDTNKGRLYNAMWKRFDAGLKTIVSNGDTPNIRGFLWMQGEQDSKNELSASEYAANLKLLKMRVAEDLDVSVLPMVFGQVLPHSPALKRFTHRDAIRSQMAAADAGSGEPEAIPLAKMVSTDSFPLLKDNVHYDTQGQWMLGQAMAKAMKGLSTEKVVLKLWPEKVPGQVEAKQKSQISSNRSRGVTRLSKVTDPSLTVYAPTKSESNGAAVIVCPGGGYNALAIDLEGYEIGEWLSDLGYTAFVLQYRVPKKQAGALQDAQRAIRMVRSMREQWGIDSDKIGIMGFSAGGSLSARASTRYGDELYPAVGAKENVSARPDFTVLIYPAYLDLGKSKTLTPELKLTAKTPPMFLYVASDDHFANSSEVMASNLKEAKIPYELHVSPKGGHGYGMRPGNPAAEAWPALCKKWLESTVFAK